MNDNFNRIKRLRSVLIGFLCMIFLFDTGIISFAKEKLHRTVVVQEDEEVVEIEENTVYISDIEVKKEENGWIKENVDGKDFIINLRFPLV